MNNIRCMQQHMPPCFMPPEYQQANDLSSINRRRVVLDRDLSIHQVEQRGLEEISNAPSHFLQPVYHHHQLVHHHYLTHGRVHKKHRSASPWNHTYTEIHEGHVMRREDDPVYEEIERTGARDTSDDDAKRQSDMSRQSSRSYSDHRPLIPCSPDRSNLECLVLSKYQSAALTSALAAMHDDNPVDHQACLNENARTIAFLEGDTVVCHLQTDNPYSPRSVVLSPYSEC